MVTKGKAVAVLSVCVVLTLVWMAVRSFTSGQSNALLWEPIQKSNTIKTNFFGGAHLSASELEQVLSLARLNGIHEVDEVRMVPNLPATNVTIVIKSVGRVDGRNLSYDMLLIWRIGGHGRDPSDAIVKRAGDFWCKPNGKLTRLLRRYEFNHQRVGVEIGEGVDIAIADKVIPLIGAKKVTLEGGPLSPPELAVLVTSPPVLIERSHSDGPYRLHFSTDRFLEFEYGWGRVKVTGVGSIIY